MGGRLDAVGLSVMVSALAGIAEEMGAVLVRAAYSSNIKERRDCSTALFDAAGRMVAQAEHIPVHLGAMPEAVEEVARRDPRPGDAFILNDPYSGGTHLPDLTLISPLHLDDQLLGYAVTRAHHSDVGGMRPGSMPADSNEILQEGLVIPPVRLVRQGSEVEGVLDLILANSRTPDLRRGDLRAQTASNALAQRRLTELIDRRGLDTVLAAFDEVVAYTERIARRTIAEVADGRYVAEGELEGDGVDDDDIPIRVAVTVEGDEMTIDFAGTSPAVRGNVNCPLPVTRSACYFALRVLLPSEIPTNAGAYAPTTILAPEGSLVNARSPSAIVAGNVETSQRIADTVLRAFARAMDLPAEGQGTMNNLVIGGGGWSYYETLGGGQGGSNAGPGASGVHVGMTNTLNTPIEALELELPLRVERYELAYGTGGVGAHRGGDGLVRSIRALEPAAVSLLTDRRRHAPQGSRGGGPGTPGRNLVDGSEVGPKVSLDIAEGSVVTVQTPGGGGWGRGGDSPMSEGVGEFAEFLGPVPASTGGPGITDHLVERLEAVSRLRTARVARLASVRPDGRPHVVPIVFALIDDGEELRVYWSVDRKPKRSTELQRLRNISANPHVELVVDGYEEAWDRLWWVRAAGTSRTVEDANEAARALTALTNKYPQYAGSPPDGPVVAIEVTAISGWQAAPSAAR